MFMVHTVKKGLGHKKGISTGIRSLTRSGANLVYSGQCNNIEVSQARPDSVLRVCKAAVTQYIFQ